MNISAQAACWLLRKRHETLSNNKYSKSNPVPSVYLYSALVQLLSTLIVHEDITLVLREIYLFHLFIYFIFTYDTTLKLVSFIIVNIFAPTILISISNPEPLSLPRQLRCLNPIYHPVWTKVIRVLVDYSMHIIHTWSIEGGEE